MKLIRCDECKNEISESGQWFRCYRPGLVAMGDWTELEFCSDGCAADWFERNHDKQTTQDRIAKLEAEIK